MGEKEDLEILEEKLIEATFPPGCYWRCYLANHPRLAKKIENTKEAALDHWTNGRQKGVKWDCTCKEGTLIEGKSQPELEEEVINAMIDIEEELEGKDNNAAKIEKEDLEPLATELVEPAFPSGCYWECFLANHPRLKKRIDYTEEAALDHWVNRKKGIRWDCTCKEGMMIERNPQPESTGEVVNAIIEIEEDIKEFEQEKTREQKKKEKLEKREQNQQAALDHWMNGRQKGVKWDCTCKEGTLIEGKSQPELEEEVINAMIDIEEELEGKDNNAAKIEKEDLEPLATELVEPAFPSGCYWECFL